MQQPTRNEVPTYGDRIQVPNLIFPSGRAGLAEASGLSRKLLFQTWGGIGDLICTEPTLRRAFKVFDKCEIHLASTQPALFAHLPFKNVWDLNGDSQPAWEKFFIFRTIVPPNDPNDPAGAMVWSFFSHGIVNCVDFPSMCTMREQIPIAEKHIVMLPNDLKMDHQLDTDGKKHVLIHPGRHWQIKTFPKDWWDKVIFLCQAEGLTPVLIGGDADDNRGTVNVNTDGCVDLRNKLSIVESIRLCKQAKVLLTNDSAPLHMAASGNAWIGFVATCKHPDYITHWRKMPNGKNKFQWREENLGLGGIWDLLDLMPNKAEGQMAEKVEPHVLEGWLPEPQRVAKWAKEKYEKFEIFD